MGRKILLRNHMTTRNRQVRDHDKGQKFARRDMLLVDVAVAVWYSQEQKKTVWLTLREVACERIYDDRWCLKINDSG